MRGTILHFPLAMFVLACIAVLFVFVIAIYLAHFIGKYQAEKALTESRVNSNMERKYGHLLAEVKLYREERKKLFLANTEMSRKLCDIGKVLNP